jgi:Carboxypeptidase regulatory-like domain
MSLRSGAGKNEKSHGDARLLHRIPAARAARFRNDFGNGSQDAVVTTATVTVSNVDTGVAKTVPVTQAGQYTVPFLTPGAYSVSAEATSPILESASVTLGQVIETRRIVDLPLNGRDPTSLASLAPGVTPSSAPLTAAQGGNIPVRPYSALMELVCTLNSATASNVRRVEQKVGCRTGIHVARAVEWGRHQHRHQVGHESDPTARLIGSLRNSAVDANDFLAIGPDRRSERYAATRPVSPREGP